MTRFITSLLLIIVTLASARAYDYKIGDLCYKMNDDGATVTVVSEKDNGAPRYSSLSGTVTIPRMVLIENKPYTVTAIASDAFYYCSQITEVTIGDAITTIGSYAFDECTGLTSVTFGRSLKTIDYGAFRKCKALTSLDFPSSVEEIGSSAFDDCTSLVSVSLPSSLLKLDESAFAYCSKLETITGGENVEYIGRSALDYTKWYKNQPNGIVYFGKVALGFRGDVPETINLKEGIVSTADYFLSGQNGLLNITFPSTLKRIGENSFEACRKLNNVTFPSSLESIGEQSFDACLAFTEVVIPDNVTTIEGNAFSRCTGLQSLTIGKGVTNIGGYAFTSCSGLQNVYSYPNPDNVTLGKSVFSYSSASSTCELHVLSDYFTKYQNADQWKDFYKITGDLPGQSDFPKGDLNKDSKVNVADVGLLYSYILGKATILSASECDLNNDGSVNTGDVGKLYEIILTSTSK